MADKLGECCYSMSLVGRRKIVRSCKTHCDWHLRTYAAVHMTTNYACKRKKDKVCDGWIDTIIFTECLIICSLGLIVSVMLLLYMLYSIFLPIYMHIYSTCQLLWALACLKSKHVGWSFVYFRHASKERFNWSLLHLNTPDPSSHFKVSSHIIFIFIAIIVLFYFCKFSFSPLSLCKIQRKV